MIQYSIRRLIAGISLIFIASSLVFFSIRILPGDPALLVLGEQGTSDPAVLASMRHKLGTDQPVVVQYGRWLGRMSRGDLGESISSGLPVSELLEERVPRSLELIFGGLVIAVFVGIPLGVVAARRSRGPTGALISGVGILGLSAPSFVLGVFAIIVFSLWFPVLPSSGYAPLTEGLLANLKYAVLPSLTLGVGFAGMLLRVTRASVSDTLQRDFIRNARARGLGERALVYRHALPNSLIPVMAVLGVRVGALLGGTVVTENLFNWPGLSSLLVESAYSRDYPVLEGCLVSIFIMFTVLTVLVDVSVALIDPRIQHA